MFLLDNAKLHNIHSPANYDDFITSLKRLKVFLHTSALEASTNLSFHFFFNSGFLGLVITNRSLEMLTLEAEHPESK